MVFNASFYNNNYESFFTVKNACAKHIVPYFIPLTLTGRVYSNRLRTGVKPFMIDLPLTILCLVY